MTVFSCVPRTVVLALGVLPGLLAGQAWAGPPVNFLYPDMFPFVEEDAPPNMQTLQNWQLSGSNLQYSSMFANQGDGLFEIRRGSGGDGRHHGGDGIIREIEGHRIGRDLSPLPERRRC